MEEREEGRLYTYRYTVTTRMTPAFYCFIIVRDKVARRCPQTTTFEEEGEPKRIRTEVKGFPSNRIALRIDLL